MLLPLQGDFVLYRKANYAEALVPIRASATFYHVVAELLTFLNDIHIQGSYTIGIEMVIHIIQVLVSELSTEVIDFRLNIIGMVHVDSLSIVSKHKVHLGKRLIYQLEHLMDVLILLAVELLLVLSLALNGAGKVEATVTNTLNLGNRTQHRTNLCLGIITQMGIAHLIQDTWRSSISILSEMPSYFSMRS